MSERTENIVTNKGKILTVLHEDGSTEEVKVKLVPTAQLSKLAEYLDQEQKLAEFVCDKPDGWAETLDLESVIDIAEANLDINFTRLNRFLQYRQKLGTKFSGFVPKK